MSIDFDTVREHIESLDDRIQKWDGVIKVADTTLLDTEKVLAHADRALEVTEQKIEENRHLLPKVAFGLLVVGVAAGTVFALKKRRKAADQWQVLEQPDEQSDAPSVQAVKVAAADKADEVKDDAAQAAENLQEATESAADDAKDAAQQ